MTNIQDDFCGQPQPHDAHPWNTRPDPGMIVVPHQCAGIRLPVPVKDEDRILAAVLRRYLTAEEPGYNSTAFFDLHDDSLVVDGIVEIDPIERFALNRVIEGE